MFKVCGHPEMSASPPQISETMNQIKPINKNQMKTCWFLRREKKPFRTVLCQPCFQVMKFMIVSYFFSFFFFASAHVDAYNAKVVLLWQLKFGFNRKKKKRYSWSSHWTLLCSSSDQQTNLPKILLIVFV